MINDFPSKKGDVPVLDKGSKSLSIRLRQGGFILVCFIAFGASQKSHGRAIGSVVNHIPEASVSRLVISLQESERISITDFPKNVDSFGAVFKARELVGFEPPIKPSDYSKIGRGPQVRIARGFLGRIRYWLFDEGIWQNLHANPLRYSISRSLTSVYGPHGNYNFGVWPEGRMIGIAQVGENIGPQLSARSPDHNDKDKGLNEGSNDSRAGENDHPPIGRRLITMIGGIGSGILLALNSPDDDRVLLRAACVGGGCILIGGGLGLWWATLFPATWGWLL